MTSTNPPILEDVYKKFLETIERIKFTRREIDIISCLIRRRGSTIPSFLAVSQRTVETHIRNIMLKLGCNSRESIINFIENSGKLPFIERHYQNLVAYYQFENLLRKVRTLKAQKPKVWLIVHQEDDRLPVDTLLAHLQLTGIQTALRKVNDLKSFKELVYETNRTDKDYVLFLFSEKEAIQLTKSSSFAVLEMVVYLVVTEENEESIYPGTAPINFKSQKDYFFSFFELLKKLIPSGNLAPFTEELDKYYTAYYIAPLPPLASSQLNPNPTKRSSLIARLPEKCGALGKLLLIFLIVLEGVTFTSIFMNN